MVALQGVAAGGNHGGREQQRHHSSLVFAHVERAQRGEAKVGREGQNRCGCHASFFDLPSLSTPLNKVAR
jgi:hypothetical protein